MSSIKKYIILLLLVSGNRLHAQQTINNIFILGANEITKPQINCLYQNADGLILCATNEGLYNFDGFNFNPYPSLIKNASDIRAIFQDSKKQIWLGYANGTLAHIENGKIAALKFPEGVPKVAITSFAEDASGAIWMGTAGEGIYYYVNKKWYNINTDDGLSDDYVYKIIYNPSLGMIAGTDRGINFCKIEKSQKIISGFSSVNGLPDNIVRSICCNSKNEVFTGMQDAGIGLYKPGNTYTHYGTWKYGTVNDMAFVSSNLYIATADSSLVVCTLNPANNKIVSVSANKAITKTSCILKDREENIWVAGDNKLMRCGTIAAQKILPLTPLLADEVHCLYSCSDTCLWLNEGNIITRMLKQNGVWQKTNFNIPAPRNAIVSSIYKDEENNLWIGTMGNGIFLLNPNTGKTIKQDESLFSDKHNIIHITGTKNTIWVSSLEGVIKAEKKVGGFVCTDYTDTAGIGNKYVYDIFTDSRGRTWFGTDGNGIYMLDNGRFTNLQTKTGYMGDVVYEIHEDAKGNIWYATYDKGVVKFDGKNFTSYTTENGLSDPAVSGLLKVGVYMAVLHKNSIDIINSFNSNFISLDKTKNVSSLNTDLNAYSGNGTNTLYFAGADGIYQFVLPQNSVQAPSVFINAVDLFLNNIPLINGHSFTHNQNNLSFYYTGIYYSQPELLHYQYRLDGYDKDWVNTTDNVKNFPRLPPGHYTFRVRVSLNKNFSSASEASFSFVIENPFWEQWWFIALCIAGMASIIYIVIKFRENQIKKWDVMEKQKVESQLETLRSQINPHFLFNSFNTLISEIETNPEMAVEYTETLSDFYRSIVMYRDKDLITLDEELEVLKNYYYLQKKRYSNGFEMNINVPDAERNKYYIAPLVLQLLAENAIKHNIISETSPLKVCVYMEGEDYIIVQNNINLKIQPEKGSGMGIENIRKRYTYLSKKELMFITTGTNFIAKIPIIKTTRHD